MRAANTRKINAQNPNPDIIKEAVNVIDQGGVIVFPTRGLYGLGADIFNAQAVQSIFEIKQRNTRKPVSILINDEKILAALADDITPAAVRVMDHFWPGNITFIFKAHIAVPADITAATGKIGIRLPGHPVARALTAAVKNPITATSANLSGHRGCFDLRYLDHPIKARADLILDAGPLEGGPGSTVVDISSNTPKILREGAISSQEFFKALKA